jgi:hypothetical protein
MPLMRNRRTLRSSAAVLVLAGAALLPVQAAHAEGSPSCDYTAARDITFSTATGDPLVEPGTVYCTGNPSTFELVSQADGNLVIYNAISTRALWASNTDVGARTTAEIQEDGNFVIYSSSGAALWSTHTQGHRDAYLCFQDDGNLVVYFGASGCTGQVLWASGT